VNCHQLTDQCHEVLQVRFATLTTMNAYLKMSYRTCPPSPGLRPASGSEMS